MGIDLKRSLQYLSPNIAAEWHPTKNGELTPNDVTAGSHKKVWWQCSKFKNHEWDAVIKSRSKSGNGCPICSNKRVNFENSLAALSPELSKEWHPTKNYDLTPYDVVNGSHKKVWWQCSKFKNHEWDAVIKSRSKSGNGCPHCTHQSSIPEVRVLSELESIFNNVISRKKINGVEVDIYIPDIEIAIEYDGVYYHKDKLETDRKKNKFLEKEGIRLIRVREMPLRKITETDILVNSVELKKDDLNKLLLVIKKEIESSSKVLISDINRYLQLNNFSEDEKFRSYIACFPAPLPQNSLANLYPDIAKEWHKNKNQPLTPEQFSPFSQQKVWWQCLQVRKHTWDMRISDRTKKRYGCPFCSNKRVSPNNSLTALAPEIAKEWHPTKNGDLTPDDVVNGSHKKVWWQCLKFEDHEWDAVIKSRTARGDRCPFCSNKRVSPENSLHAFYPEIAKEWHPTKNGELTPNDVTAGSHKKVWWQCSKFEDHEWYTQIRYRTSENRRPTGCPFCSRNREY